MDVSELLLELYGRIPPLAAHAVNGLNLDQLVAQPSPGANTIGWLVWHLAAACPSHVDQRTRSTPAPAKPCTHEA